MNATPKRILVVDDDERIRSLLRGLLEDQGYAVEVADGGQAAVNRVVHSGPPPDLILLDLVMPEVDGWGVLERIHSQLPRTPVVVLSPRSNDPRNGPFQEAIAGHLFKPFHPGELIATCRRILATPNLLAAGAERRREPRRRLVVDVTLLSQDGTPAVVGRLGDVSSAGLQMELDLPLEAGEDVLVALHIPGPQAMLPLRGRILWRNPTATGFVFGVDLVDLSAEHERILRTVLDR